MKSAYERFQHLFDKLIEACEEARLKKLSHNLNKGRKAASSAHKESQRGTTGTPNLKALEVQWELPGIKTEYFWHKNKLTSHTRELFDEFFEMYPREVDRMYWRRRDVKPDQDYLPIPSKEKKGSHNLWDLPEPDVGDVLLVRRHIPWLPGKPTLYEHYAVYLGNNEVMHYAAEGKDFGGRISIHQAPLSAFSGGSRDVYKLEFPVKSGLPCVRTLDNELLNGLKPGPFDFSFYRDANYHLFTPAETVARARSREGEHTYALPFNNCEHFAVWCKTGVKESFQVNRVLEWIVALLPRR